MIEFLPKSIRAYVVGGVIAVAGASVAWALDAKIERHLNEVKNSRQMMLDFAKYASESLQALCKATPAAQCPNVPPPTFGGGERK